MRVVLFLAVVLVVALPGAFSATVTTFSFPQAPAPPAPLATWIAGAFTSHAYAAATPDVETHTYPGSGEWFRGARFVPCKKMFIPPLSPVSNKDGFTTSVVFATSQPGAGTTSANWFQRSHVVSVDGCPFCNDHGIGIGAGGYVAGGIGRTTGGEMQFKSEDNGAYRVNDGAVHVASFSANLNVGGTSSSFALKVDALDAQVAVDPAYTAVSNSDLNTTFGDNAFVPLSPGVCFDGHIIEVRFTDEALEEAQLAAVHEALLAQYPASRIVLSGGGGPEVAGTTGSIDMAFENRNSGVLSPVLVVGASFIDVVTGDSLSSSTSSWTLANMPQVGMGFNVPSRVGRVLVVAELPPTLTHYVRAPNATYEIDVNFDVSPGPASTVENTPFTLTLIGAAPTGGCTLTASTCGALSWTRASPSTFEVTVPPQDFEAAASCSFDVAHHSMAAAQTVVVSVTDGDDAPVASDLGLVYRTTAEYGTGLIPVALPVTDEDASAVIVLSITGVPTVAAVALPGTTTEIVAGDLPATLPAGVVSLFLKRGEYNDSFTWSAESNGVVVGGRVDLAVSVPCTLGRTPENLDGTCICPGGTFVNITDGCQACRPGTYYTGAAVANPCDACVFGGFCSGGVEPPVPDNGFSWADGDQNSTVYARCRPAAVCVRGGTCRPGSVGVLCADCLGGYYKKSGLCTKCPSTAPILLVILFVLMVVLAVVLVKLARKSAAYYVSWSVALGFLQVLAVVSQFDLNWGFVSTAFNLLSIFSFQINIFAPECAMAGGAVAYFPIWLFKLFIPVMFAGLFGVFHLFLEVYRRVRARISEVQHPVLARAPLVTRTQVVLLRNATVNAYVSILVMMYLVLISVTFEAFDCQGGAMVKAPDVVCGSPEWRKFLGVALVSMFVYGLGIPALFASLVWWHRLSLFSELTIVRLGLLYRRYRPGFHYFELAILARKLGIVSGVLFFNTVVPQALCAMAALLVGLGVQMYMQPFITSRVNRLEAFGVGCSAVIVACGLVLFGAEKGGSEGFETFVRVVVVLIIGVNIAFIGLVVGLEARYQYRRIARGVQSGFASDEVMLDERFFKLDFRVRAHERNIMGTVSALTLSSRPGIEVRVELCDGAGRLLSEFDGRSTSTVQSDGELHSVVTIFSRVGRFQLKVFAWDVVEAKYLHNSVFDEHEVMSEAGGSGLQPVRRAEQADSRTLYDRLTCQERSTVRRPVLAYHMNCDVPPQAVVSFSERTGRMVEEGGIVVLPRFRELSRFVPHTFEVRAQAAVGLVLAPTEPALLEDGIELVRDESDLGLFRGQVAFNDPGPMLAWGQYLRTEVGEGEPPYYFAHLATWEVLEGRVGWEDIDRESSKHIISRLVESSGVEMHAVMEAEMSATDPPDVSDEFVARRGLLYLPKARTVRAGDGGIHVEVRLPSAVDVRVSGRQPTTAADGVPMFKRDDGVYVADATWETLGVGVGDSVSVWATFADVAGYAGARPSVAGLAVLGDEEAGAAARAGRSSSALFGSSKPTMSAYLAMVGFVVK